LAWVFCVGSGGRRGQTRTGPGLSLITLALVEVPDRCGCERLAEDRHSVLPCLVADQSKPFNVPGVFQIELDVLPEGTRPPAVKILHLDQHANLAVLIDRTLDLRNEVLVVLLRELAAEPDRQDSPIVFCV